MREWPLFARGAAMTQGMSLPPMTRAKSGFLRLRAFCGDAEATPIHPFLIEHRISETEGIAEGLYVFDPAALGASCGMVKLTVSHDELEAGSGMDTGIRRGWPIVLSSLKSLLETGQGIDVFAKPKVA
jgi:hypothetical protein